MPDLLKVPPTRGQLLDLQDSLTQIREGHGLLDQKREVLLQELMKRLKQAKELNERGREAIETARDALVEARIHMGTDRIRWLSQSPGVEVETSIRAESIMGVEVPLVTIEINKQAFPYGPGNTSPAVDRARQRWLEVLNLLAEMTEVISTVWRLAQELRKTQRRVNALEDIVIPRYVATIDSIEDKLAEEERASIIRAKRVKQMRQE